MICPLCHSKSITFFIKDKKRFFIQCQDCSLVFVPRNELLSSLEEQKRYNLHDNSIENRGYVKYLSEMADVLETLKISNPKVLDFGSGKNAVLEKILKKREILCQSYDPLYNLGMSTLNNYYDVVISCEVMEHVYNISKELKLISSVLKNGGYLILRTELFDDSIKFKSWWYKEDPTHINFFKPETIKKVSKILGGEIIWQKGSVVVLKIKTS